MHQSEQDPEFLMTQHIKIEKRITKFWWIRDPDKEKQINFSREIKEKRESEKTKRILPYEEDPDEEMREN